MNNKSIRMIVSISLNALFIAIAVIVVVNNAFNDISGDEWMDN